MCELLISFIAGEIIYSAEHLHETQTQDYLGYKREKQTVSHAI